CMAVSSVKQEPKGPSHLAKFNDHLPMGPACPVDTIFCQAVQERTVSFPNGCFGQEEGGLQYDHKRSGVSCGTFVRTRQVNFGEYGMESSRQLKKQDPTMRVRNKKMNDPAMTLSLEVPPPLMFPMTVTPLGRDQDCSLKNQEPDVRPLGSWILEVGARPLRLDCTSSSLESVPCPLYISGKAGVKAATAQHQYGATVVLSISPSLAGFNLVLHGCGNWRFLPRSGKQDLTDEIAKRANCEDALLTDKVKVKEQLVEAEQSLEKIQEEEVRKSVSATDTQSEDEEESQFKTKAKKVKVKVFFSSSSPESDLEEEESLTNCWRSGTLPEILLMTLKAQAEYPAHLYRPKRDFDITASVVATIAIFTIAATTAGIAGSQNVQTVTTVNKLAERVSSALDLQNQRNEHLHFGLLILNRLMAGTRTNGHTLGATMCSVCP
ncbi:hypothetical protein STEG23_024496, partial [Scotinomys teguina]